MSDRSEDILFERRDSIGIITFNRPEALNAFRAGTYRRLIDILGEVAQDASTRALVFAGTGRAFCAGTDLKELQDPEDPPAVAVERNQEITRRIVALDPVTIAAVHGYAVGFGAELAIACDIRVAAESARFLFAEVERALFVTNGVTWMLPRIVGLGRAMEWLTTGRPISAAEALGAGLVTEYVPEERVAELALDIASRIARNAPLSVRLTKRALQDRPDSLEDALALEVAGVLACRESPNWEEGVRSFIERRDPIYEDE